jgi:hypothetical protein
MIKVSSIDGKQKVFESYHQVCKYLNGIERKKAVETGEMRWMFIRRPYESISTLYYTSPSWKSRLTPKEREAVEKRLELVEIRKGDRKNFIQLLYRSFLDMEPLKRNWCHEYGAVHRFEITEFVSKNIA